jgi:predicted lipid-binding transport protein (Tim44 family)
MGLAIAIPDAEAARRLGGGKSVGSQRQSTQQQAEPRQGQQQQAAPQQGPTGAAAPAAGNRWLGPVAGLLAGGLLGAMFFGGAFDGIKLMDVVLILLLAAGIFYLFKMMRKPQAQPARREPLQYAGVGAEPRAEPELRHPSAAPAGVSATAQPAASYFPAGFDAEAFARQAKSNFLRLQEANDRADLGALRDMMTPALYSEIEAQVRERGNEPQKTEVVTLDAKVMEVVSEGDHYIASVRFSGLIREEPSAQPESFDEIWHLQKPLNGATGWVMAGIQQA